MHKVFELEAEFWAQKKKISVFYETKEYIITSKILFEFKKKYLLRNWTKEILFKTLLTKLEKRVNYSYNQTTTSKQKTNKENR